MRCFTEASEQKKINYLFSLIFFSSNIQKLDKIETSDTSLAMATVGVDFWAFYPVLVTSFFRFTFAWVPVVIMGTFCFGDSFVVTFKDCGTI